MTGDDVAIAIDQDRNNEPKGLDAVTELPNLLLAVLARIGGVRLDLVDPTINNR